MMQLPHVRAFIVLTGNQFVAIVSEAGLSKIDQIITHDYLFASSGR